MFTRYEGKAWDEHFLPRLTYQEVKALKKGDALVVLPIGAVEQHGAHLPVATDMLIGEASITKAFEALTPGSNIWLIPPLSYGKSNEHIDFPGTLTLTAKTLQAVLEDIGDSLARSGFKKLALYNSHGGNVDLLNVMAREIHVKTGMTVFVTSSGTGNVKDVFSEEELKWGIHGGDVETSMVMAMKPEWVHMDKAVCEFPPLRDTKHIGLIGAKARLAWKVNELSYGGTAGDATKAASEKGDTVYLRSAEEMAEALEEMAAFEMDSLLKTTT